MIPGYFAIDDTTWNDLSMEDVYGRIDVCGSSVGKEYLKKSLRTLLFDEKVLAGRSESADYLSENPETLRELKKAFSDLGISKKVSFKDYIFRLNEVKRKGNAIHIVLIILLLAAVAALFFMPVAGIIGIVVMFAVNIGTYFGEKGKIEGYFLCVKYLCRMVGCAGRIAALSLAETPLSGHAAALKRLRGTFASVKRGSWLITTSVSGSIVDVIMDYVRMLFHVDLIKFNNSVKKITENSRYVCELYDTLGEIELSICVANYRERLGLWCVPEFDRGGAEPEHDEAGFGHDEAGFGHGEAGFDRGGAEPRHGKAGFGHRGVEFADLAHPLIENPVRCSLSAEKSILLTGSNASGKSTFLKSIAVNQIFAQTIYTCLASEYKTAFYKVLSSMALSDNILGKESYFVVEIKSLKRILDEMGDVTVMCFIDEVLRGTNTAERIAASSVILRHMAEGNALVFAATHDIELTEMLRGVMANYHFSETVEGSDVLFDYKLKEGPSDSRNAIKLLGMFGFGKEITDEAERQCR